MGKLRWWSIRTVDPELPKLRMCLPPWVVNECQQMAGGNMSEAAKRQRDGDLLEWEHDVESIVSYLGRVQNLPFPLPSTVEIPMWVVRWKISPSCMWTQKFPCRKTCPLWIGDAPSAPWIRWRTRTFATWRWLLWLLRNDDMNGYLEWIAKTYGTQGSGSRRGRLRRPLTLPCAWKLFAGRLRWLMMELPSLTK